MHDTPVWSNKIAKPDNVPDQLYFAKLKLLISD